MTIVLVGESVQDEMCTWVYTRESLESLQVVQKPGENPCLVIRIMSGQKHVFWIGGGMAEGGDLGDMVCAYLRGQRTELPLVAESWKVDEEDQRSGLEFGKPFNSASYGSNLGSMSLNF